MESSNHIFGARCFSHLFSRHHPILNLVITEFVDTSLAAIKGGLHGRHDIESAVRFCVTVLIIIGVIKILTKKDNE